MRVCVHSGTENVRRLFAATAVALALPVLAVVLDAEPAHAAGTVQVIIAGQGSATAPGISCDHSGGPDCSEFYPDTEVCEFDPETRQNICIDEPPVVGITAAAAANGYAFQGWTGCDAVSGRICTLTVVDDTALRATYNDVQPPSVGSLSPAAGVQRGTITLGATASDNSGVIAQVEFRVRGVLVGTDSTAPYSLSLDTSSLGDGATVIRATAVDAAGNSSSAESSVVFDNTAPILTVTGGPNGETFGPGSTQSWTFSAADATSGLAALQCSVVPTGSAPSFGSCSGPGGSHTVTDAPGGDFTFAVRAFDNGGMETTRTRAFAIDDTGPETSITSGIAGGAVTNQTTHTWEFSSSETGSTFECRVHPAASAPPAFGACSGIGSHTVSGLSSGPHRLQVRAVDAVGNPDSTPAESTWTVDAVKPTVRGMSPVPRALVRDRTPAIKATVRDNLANLAKRDLRLFFNGKAIPAAKYTYNRATDRLTYGAPRLAKGRKTVRITARDVAGNLGSKSWSFTIK